MISFGELIGLVLIAGLIWFVVRLELRRYGGIRRHRFFRRREFREIFGFWPPVRRGNYIIDQACVDRVMTFLAEEYLVAQKRRDTIYELYTVGLPRKHFPVAPWVDRMMARYWTEMAELACTRFDRPRILAGDFGFEIKPLAQDYLRYDSPIREQLEDILDARDRPTQPMPNRL